MLTGPSSTSSRNIPGPRADLGTLERRLAILFSYRPFARLEPIDDEPAEGSLEEVEQFRSTCLVLTSQPEDDRRALLTEDQHEQYSVIALSVFRCPEDLEYALYRLAVLMYRCASPLLVFLTSADCLWIIRMFKEFCVWRTTSDITNPAIYVVSIAYLKLQAGE